MSLSSAASVAPLAPAALLAAGFIFFSGVRASRKGIIATTWLTVLYYLQWRVTTTVPWESSGWAFWWPALCLFIEVAALFDAAILFMILLRPTDRSAEADQGEARLRTLPGATLPPVDVFIATYNEPREVLEKTILGCLALDWPEARVWVLDDGRRVWVKELCAAKGAGYITRPDNKGAKAGNINHALSLTSAPYVAVFDADFVPQQNFLMRTMGFFADPKIGIVQVPHSFYNNDPFQTNLSLQQTMPDDQRFFFEAIMPGRDSWNAAFCCGSNSVTRRELFEAIGGGFPEGSITEDMLLTLASLRRGYVTRYLNEPLAYGLAPESVSAFFVQRQRWAQGSMQILHLPEGPLAKGLGLVHRLMFLPTPWITQGLALIFSFITPAVFLLFNLPPLVNVDRHSALHYILPMVVALIGGTTLLAPGRYFPAAAQVLGAFQSFRILPVALQTLVRPKGLIFKVTPKGAAATGAGWETGIWTATVTLIALNVLGLTLNLLPDYRIVDQQALLPMVALWSVINIVLLMLVGMLCLQKPALRSEERFKLRDEVVIISRAEPAFLKTSSGDISLSGIGVRSPGAESRFRVGMDVTVQIAQLGQIPGRVTRVGGQLGIAFRFPTDELRDRLTVYLFTHPIAQNITRPSAAKVAAELLRRLWSADLREQGVPAPASVEDPRRLEPATLVLPGRLKGDAVAAAEDVGHGLRAL